MPLNLDFEDFADPDRESLTNKFSQGKVGEGLGQMVKMVTPQSLWAPEPGLDTVLNDFVEYSLYGDAKDLWAGVNPDSGLDWLERSMAVVSALPFLALSYRGGKAAVNGAVKIEEYLTSGAALRESGIAPVGGMAVSESGGVDGAVNMSMAGPGGRLEFPEDNIGDVEQAVAGERTAAEQTAASAQVMAQVFMETSPSSVILNTRSFDQLTTLMVDRHADRLRPAARQSMLADLDWRDPDATEKSDNIRRNFDDGKSWDPTGSFDASMRQLGVMLVQMHDDHIPFEGRNKDGEVVTFSAETRELIAAQYSLASALGAIQAGVLFEATPVQVKYSEDALRTGKYVTPEEIVTEPMTEDKLLSGLFNTTQAPRAVSFIYQLTSGLMLQEIGPDLSLTPQSAMTAIVVDQRPSALDRGTGALVITGVNTETLADTRLFDPDTGFVMDQVAMDDRHRRVSYEALTGDFVVNLLRALLREKMLNPARFEKSLLWYHNANATARFLASTSGKSVATVSAVFAALSPQSAWTPDNLVAGTHVILRYTHPEIHPGSAEYQQLFASAINEGGWADALWQWSSVETQSRVGSVDGIVAHYGNIDNFIVEKGTALRGMADAAKQQSAMQLLLMDIEWPLVIRHMKTHNFAVALENPFMQFLVAVDTHQSAAMLGSSAFGEAIVSVGDRNLGRLRDGTVTGSEVHVGSGSSRLTPSMIEDMRQEILTTLAKKTDKGKVTPEMEAIAAQAVKRARSIPSSEQMARYSPAAMAHVIVSQITGVSPASSAQAGIWVFTQDHRAATISAKKGLGKHEGLLAQESVDYYVAGLKEKGFIEIGDTATAERVAALKQVWDQVTWDTTIIDHLEGTPGMQAGVAGRVRNATDAGTVLPDGFFEPAQFRSHGPNKFTPGQAIQIVSRHDGTVEVWGDTSVDSVHQALRSLAPTQMTNGQYTRFVPRQAVTVEHVSDKAASLSARTDPSGRLLDAEVRQVVMPGGAPLAASMPGNHVVFEFEKWSELEDAQTLVSNIAMVDMSTASTGMTRIGGGTRPLVRSDLSSIVEPRDTTLDDHAWVAISAENPGGVARGDVSLNRADNHALRKDLEAALREANPGMTARDASRRVIRQEGVWGGQKEWSFFVAGLPYKDAIRLGEKYGQESVATRDGMVYTTGENAGKYNPRSDSVRTAPGGSFRDDRSAVRTSDGQVVEYQAQYDWETLEDLPGDVESLAVPKPQPGYRYQLVVGLGGVDSNMSWQVSDQIVRAGQKARPLSTAMYLTDGSKVPHGFVPAYESHYSDSDGVTVTYRSAADHGAQSRNQYGLYVAEAEARLLTDHTSDVVKSVRTPAEARAVAEFSPDMAVVSDESTIVYSDGVFEVSVPSGQVYQAFLDASGVEMITTIDLGDGHATLVKHPKARYPVFAKARKKGRPVVTGSRKSGYLVEGYDQADVMAAEVVLRSVGVEGPVRARFAAPDLPWSTVKFKPETEFRRTGSFSKYPSDFSKSRNVPARKRIMDELGIESQWDLGDMVSERTFNMLLDSWIYSAGGQAGPHLPAVFADFVDRYGAMPLSSMDNTLFDAGLRTGRHPEGESQRIMGFVSPRRAANRTEQNVWITEKFAALDDQISDIEARVGQDRKRFPGMPATPGALMLSTFVHEQGHVIANWYDWTGYSEYFRERQNAFLKEIGGLPGASSLISDYAALRTEVLSEVMVRALQQDSGVRTAPIAPALDRFLTDVMNGMSAIDALRQSQFPGSQPSSATHGDVVTALFAGARESTLSESAQFNLRAAKGDQR